MAALLTHDMTAGRSWDRWRRLLSICFGQKEAAAPGPFTEKVE